MSVGARAVCIASFMVRYGTPATAACSLTYHAVTHLWDKGLKRQSRLNYTVEAMVFVLRTAIGMIVSTPMTVD